MKIENLKRARYISEEIINIDKIINDAEELAKAGCSFVLAEYSDSSGEFVDYVYENGNAPKDMYKEIALFAKQKFIEHKEKLLKEIESL